MSLNSGPGVFAITIQPGDNIWDLAGQNNVTISDIIAVNPGVDPNNLVVGQTILVPGDPPPMQRPGEYRRPYQPYRPYRRPFRPACPRGSMYAIQPGDTVHSIAGRYGISVRAIVDVNRHINFHYPLQPGEVICLPRR